MALTYGTATFTNGQRAVTSVDPDSGTLTYFQAGTEIAVGANPQIATVEAQKATGASSFNLKEPWPYPSGNYAFLASNTSEAFANGVQAAKGFQDALQSAVDNQGTAAAADVTTSPTDTSAGRVLRAGDAYAVDSKNYHDANLSPNKWGPSASGGVVSVGVGRASSIIWFPLSVSLVNKATTIDTNATFTIRSINGTLMTTGVSPALVNISTNKCAILEFVGMSGVTVSGSYYLQFESDGGYLEIL